VAAATTSTPKLPLNLPPQHQFQLPTTPFSLMRASSLPDDRRARKRKQERPSSALDNPLWQPEERDDGSNFLQRGPISLPPLGLPRPRKFLGRSGSVPTAPLPLFHQVARQQQQQQQLTKSDLALNLGDLPHPPPLQLAPMSGPQTQTAGVETLSAEAPAAVEAVNQHFLRAPRKQEVNNEA
jgi:hypothetical protein